MAWGAVVVADDLIEREWRLVTSANFRVLTVLPAERTVELLRHLEVMRVALGESSSVPTYQSNVPTEIVALDDGKDYSRVGAPQNSIGFFIANARENAILVQDTEHHAGVRTILHEYVHYLHRTNGKLVLPKWFQEGHAEYLSQSRINAGNFEYGLPAEDRLPGLNFGTWLPGVDLITRTNMEGLNELQADLFYGQSWLLVHYLYDRAADSSEVMSMMATYGDQMNNGLDKIAAFEHAFDLQVDELQHLLTLYLLDDQFKTTSTAIDTALPGFSPGINSLSSAEVRLALARMAMRFQNDVEAERWFRAALTDDVARPRAEAGLGTVAGFRGDIDTAEARFEAAIYLVSYDFNIWMDYSQFWAQRVSASGNFDEQEFFARRLEESLRNALTISDATPELNSLMGFSYLVQGKDIDEAIEFLQAAITASPADQGSRLHLARAYQLSGQYSQALATAETVLSYQHESNSTAAAARKIIDEVSVLMELRTR